MAFMKIPAPGNRNGPCEGECIHKDCASNRAIAAKLCPDCQTPIGYEQWFMKDETGADVHDGCMLDRWTKTTGAG